MGIPNIPQRTQDEVIIDLLESIALEETALAHIINAEGEKIQAIKAGMDEGKYSTNEVIDLQHSVTDVMNTVIKKEMLLEFKLENIFDFSKCNPIPNIFSNIATAIGYHNDTPFADTDIAYYHTINTNMCGNGVILQ